MSGYYYCLGIPFESFKLCNDFFINEYSIFNIGIFLSVVGLFFAGYQLIKPKNKLRINVKSNFFGNISFWIGIALIFSLIGSILPYIPGDAIPLIGYKIFWEIISLIMILINGIYLFIISTRPIKKINNIKKLTDIIISFIGKKGEYIDALGSELGFFIPEIINLIDKKDKDGIALMRIITDKELIDNIISNQLFTLSVILKSYSKRQLTNQQGIDRFQEEFISIIIQESLAKKESIISKEINGEMFGGINGGIGLVSQTIFQDFQFIAKYDLFSSKWFAGSYRSKINISEEVYTINYINFLVKGIDSFFEGVANNLDYYETIYNGIVGLCGYKGIIYKTEKYPNLGIYHGLYKNSETILNHFNKKIPNFDYDKEKLIDSIESQNIFDALAIGFYQLTESISYIKEDKENSFSIRHNLQTIESDIVGHSLDSPIFIAIYERVKKLFEKQILEKNIYGYYPMATRNFFHMFGYQIFTDKIDEKDKDFCLNVLQGLAKQLPLLFEGKIWGYDSVCTDITQDIQQNRLNKAKDIINDILPNYMYYDHSRHMLGYFFGSDMDKSELNLDEVLNNNIAIQNFS